MRALLVSLTAIGFVGCATLVDGTTQVVTFNSTPPGAEVLVSGSPIGVTPVSTQVKRSKNQIVTVRKEGFAEQHVTLQTKLNTTFWGNFITGGTVGSITDGISGAAIEYAPNTYFITLPPIEPTPEDQSRFERQREVRSFVLRNIDRLQRDISVGEGEHLDALLTLLRSERAPDAIVDAAKASLLSGGSAIDIANQFAAMASQ